jgi:hypothetical protein
LAFFKRGVRRNLGVVAFVDSMAKNPAIEFPLTNNNVMTTMRTCKDEYVIVHFLLFYYFSYKINYAKITQQEFYFQMHEEERKLHLWFKEKPARQVQCAENRGFDGENQRTRPPR